MNGYAENTYVDSGGQVYVNAGNNGVEDPEQGGQIVNTTVGAGGLVVNRYGIDTNTIVEAGGELATGAITGTIPAILWRNWSLIPGSALPGATLAILCGGRWLARLKRGRPESWLYRALELKLARVCIGTQRFVLHDGVWAIRRSRR
ncbi:TIGR03750 family conjugal transfer protein [Salmonella enterica]